MYSESDIQNYFETKKANDKELDKLSKRVEEVLEIIFVAFKKSWASHYQLTYWNYQYRESLDHDFNPPPEISENYNPEEEFTLSICLDPCGDDGEWGFGRTYYWDYAQGFPIKFLFMKDEDILNHVAEEIKKTKAKSVEKKRKQKEYKAKKKKLDARLAKEKKRLKEELGIK